MNSIIIGLLIVLILLLSILIGLALFLVFKLVLKKENAELPKKDNESSSSLEKDLNTRTKPSSQYKISEGSHCPNHKDNSPVGTCLICEEAFCEECLIEHESLYFCKEHFRTYANHDWEKITDILTTADTPEASMHVYDFKRELWKFEKIPTFVLTHYKINVSDDLIESYVQLHVRAEEKDTLENRLARYKKK